MGFPCISDYRRGDELDPRSPDYDDSGDEYFAAAADVLRLENIIESSGEEIEISQEEIENFNLLVREKGGATMQDVRDVRMARDLLVKAMDDLAKAEGDLEEAQALVYELEPSEDFADDRYDDRLYF